MQRFQREIDRVDVNQEDQKRSFEIPPMPKWYASETRSSSDISYVACNQKFNSTD